LKKASKVHDKVEQEFQQRDLEIQICNYGSCLFAARKCACCQRFAAMSCGGKASRVRSAKLNKKREKRI
jgi:hypothetical protein